MNFGYVERLALRTQRVISPDAQEISISPVRRASCLVPRLIAIVSSNCLDFVELVPS